jgi:hypothetical protein
MGQITLVEIAATLSTLAVMETARVQAVEVAVMVQMARTRQVLMAEMAGLVSPVLSVAHPLLTAAEAVVGVRQAERQETQVLLQAVITR